MKVLLVQWGRRNAGPLFLAELAGASQGRGPSCVLSFSGDAELAPVLEGLRLPSFRIKTGGPLRLALALLLAPVHARRLRRFAGAHDVSSTVVVMEHPVQSVAFGMFGPPTRDYWLVMHDSALHDGEANRVAAFFRARDYRRATGVVALSNDTAARARASGLVPPGVPIVISHHPSHRRPGELAERSPAARLRIGFVGRIEPYKGLELLLEAVAALRARDVDFEFEVWGAGRLDGKAKRWLSHVDRLENRYLSDGELGDVYRRFDIVVTPYLEASQSGIVAMAQAYGVAVVVTPVGALAEQIEDGVTGLVAPDVTSEALVTALDYLLARPAVVASMGRAAEQRAEELGWPALLDDLARALESNTIGDLR